MNTTPALGYDLFVAEPIPQYLAELLPNGQPHMSQPTTVTLIHGERDAVLVDPPLTGKQAQAVGDWVADSGYRVTHIVATHGHGDHWFTADVLAKRFGAQVVATAATIVQMRSNVAARELLWDALWPGQIPPSPVTAAVLPGNRFTLEGHEVCLVEVGHTDTDDTSVLHVPDLGLVAAGDVLSNGTHMHLGESAGRGMNAWRKAIDTVEALEPRWIIAGHKNEDRDDDAARVIAETRSYLYDAEGALEMCPNAFYYFHRMLERHPDRIYGSTVLWVSAKALYALREPGVGPAEADAVARRALARTLPASRRRKPASWAPQSRSEDPAFDGPGPERADFETARFDGAQFDGTQFEGAQFDAEGGSPRRGLSRRVLFAAGGLALVGGCGVTAASKLSSSGSKAAAASPIGTGSPAGSPSPTPLFPTASATPADLSSSSSGTAAPQSDVPNSGSGIDASEVQTAPEYYVHAGPKVVALTLDDGPSPTYTPQILALLEEHKITATFCVIGQQVGANRSLVSEVVAAGHTIVNHTWDHADQSKLGISAIRSEINRTNDALAEVGVHPAIFRAPYGAWSPTLYKALAAADLRPLDWSVDPQDWARPGTSAIVSRIMNHTRTGSIILEHDGGGDRSQTVAALKIVLPALLEAGYRFTTV